MKKNHSKNLIPSNLLIFLDDTTIPAGFPSPAERAAEHRLHIDDLIVRHPEATFFVKMESGAMEGAGLFEGDILVVDRSKAPRHGSIVLVHYQGDFLVRRLVKRGDGWYIETASVEYELQKISDISDTVVWGVVTHSVHSV